MKIRTLKNMYTFTEKMTLVKNIFFFYFVSLVHRKCCGGSLHINYLLNAAVFQVAQELFSLASFHSSVSVKHLVLT